MSTIEPFIVTPRAADRLRIVQISDCHLFADAGQRLLEVDTRLSLARVLDDIGARQPGADLLLASGDLAQDESAGAYRHFAACFAASGPPVFWIPGNHDDPVAMQRELSVPPLHADKLIVAGDWLLVLLDSTLPGEVCGDVHPDQLAFVDAVLPHYPDHHGLVVLHHQAVDSGSEWIDRKGFPDNATFRQQMLAHDNLRAVIWGHVHQQGEFDIGGVRWLSAPSTCAQFAPGSLEFAVGDEAPGYRWMDLWNDGRIDTGVVRVAPRQDQL